MFSAEGVSAPTSAHRQVDALEMPQNKLLPRIKHQAYQVAISFKHGSIASNSPAWLAVIIEDEVTPRSGGYLSSSTLRFGHTNDCLVVPSVRMLTHMTNNICNAKVLKAGPHSCRVTEKRYGEALTWLPADGSRVLDMSTGQCTGALELQHEEPTIMHGPTRPDRHRPDLPAIYRDRHPGH